MHTEESQWGWEVGEQELLNLEGSSQIGQDSGIKLSSGHGMEKSNNKKKLEGQMEEAKEQVRYSRV